MLSVLIVLVTFGGSGIVGAMTESMTGDRAIILARAISDLITVMMFGTSFGSIAAVSAIPCAFSLFLFFFCAKLIMPVVTGSVYANFTAAGGILTLMSGLSFFKISKAKPMNMTLSIFLVVPVTYLWQQLIG